MKIRATIHLQHIRNCECCSKPTYTLYEYGSENYQIRSRPNQYPDSSIQVCEICRFLISSLEEGHNLSEFRGLKAE